MELHTRACLPEVILGADRMNAKLKLHLDDEGRQYTVEDLLEVLQSNHVQRGVLEHVVREMVEREVYDVPIEIARGKEPKNGVDGSFIFHVKSPEKMKGPKVLENGEVEYVLTQEYVIVEKGELLAEYVPATAGESGHTVDDQVVLPARGKDLPMLKGKGFRMVDGKYYATIHGKVERTEAGFHISNLLEIKGDVDVNCGHVEFDGDVYIRGDVKSGMTVKASGNIEIKGHVGASVVEAGADISIRDGMQGKFTGSLKAGGDIFCKFFENIQAEAGGNITVKSVMNSELRASGKIIVEGREAVVLGGVVHAVQGMEIGEAGNAMEIPTVLIAGVLPQTVERNRELTQLIKKAEEEVELLDRSAKIMAKMTQTKVTKETANRRMKIIQAKVIKSAELKRYQDEKLRNEALIDSGRNAAVVIQSNIYPGCKVQIAGMQIQVREILKHVKFTLKDGDIQAVLLY